MTPTLLGAFGLAATAGAVLLLRLTWRRPRAGWRQGGLILGGWIAAAVAVVLLAIAEGFDRGAVIGLCLMGVIAYGLIALGVEIRRPRRGRAMAATPAEPLDPVPRPMRILRATARVLITVVLSTTAALALAVAWSLQGPGSAIDRVAVAAFSLPVLWGAAMSWALADDRLVRPAAGLCLITVAGAGLALLAGVS